MKQSNHLVEIVMYKKKRETHQNSFVFSEKGHFFWSVLVSHLLVFRCCFGVCFLLGVGWGVGDGLSLIWTSHNPKML